MQIRELNLKELEIAYDLVKQLRTHLSYKEFEDLIYDMRYMDYKMFGLFERDKFITYAGASICTNLYHKRHLYVYDLVTDEKYRGQKYGTSMLDYLVDYAKVGACENVVLTSGLTREDSHRLYKNYGFSKKSYMFVKEV